MTESRDYLEMSFRSIECFANDGKLDANELAKIIEIAERDGNIDANEIRVLRAIVTRINPDEIDAEMVEKLQQLSNKITDKS